MSEPEIASANSASTRKSISARIVELFRFFPRQTSRLVWIVIVLGLLLRLTVQDRYFPWALVYYITPIASLPIWILSAGITGLLGRKSPRNENTTATNPWISSFRLHLILGLIFVAWTIYADFVYQALPVSSNGIRIAFWNVERGKAGLNRLATQLKSFQAAAIGLVEANQSYEVNLEEWKRELPEYEVIRTDFGGLFAVKGNVLSHRMFHFPPSSYCEQLDVRVDGAEFTVLLVDIASDLKLSRRRPLLELATLADQLADRPLVILGDFNTPDDSVLMTPLQQHHRRAFRERGSGYAPTWPMPLPVLTLDQVWVNDLVEVQQCQHFWTNDSDHRPIVSDVLFRQSD